MERRKSYFQVREERVEPTPYALKEMPESMRPREALDRFGVGSVPDETLLALILRTGTPGLNVVGMAEALIKRYGSLEALSQASVRELEQNRIPGIGHVKAQILCAAFELGRRAALGRAPRQSIRTPSDVARLLQPLAEGLEQEHVWVILLDARNRLIGQVVEVTRGVLDSSLVAPREAFKEAVRCSAKAVIVAHNHPTGDCSPSAEDLQVTKQLVGSGRVLGIHVSDHVVVGSRPSPGGESYVSLREAGLVDFS